ncbi:methenyltetrahydromethanopterin cyclohydrolase [Mariniblastus sp.]|nr:methenyltetrahydromethanopterin cyclohydrolase [Mariniblastus sp.]MDA7924733.1 methenyltetrahydromethanopterin cyclohydrolase [Mariniblastus sp.]
MDQQPNQLAHQLFEMAVSNRDALGIRLDSESCSRVLDFAVGRAGSLDAGILLGQICMGGLGRIVVCNDEGPLGLRSVEVSTDEPLLACIGSQYAGWPISCGDYFAMGSGPVRMLRGEEEILTAYELAALQQPAVGVLESNQMPPDAILEQMAEESGIEPNLLNVCVARTASWPGAVQVVARSIEVAMHKLNELQFDLRTICSAKGTAPLPPLAGDDMTALGWTNDAILYGGRVEIVVDTTDDAVNAVIDLLPSSSSSEFGAPFLDIFERYNKDFYKIDKMLFSPASVRIDNQATGTVWDVGEIRHDVLRRSFGIE